MHPRRDTTEVWGEKNVSDACSKRENSGGYLNQQNYLYTQQIFFSPQWKKKMGQWPIFSGASLLLTRLALPPLVHISLSLSLSSPLSLLWAFELISAGRPCCLIGHNAVCKEMGRASSFPPAPSSNLLSSPNPMHMIKCCVLTLSACASLFFLAVPACDLNGKGAVREYNQLDEG